MYHDDLLRSICDKGCIVMYEHKLRGTIFEELRIISNFQFRKYFVHSLFQRFTDHLRKTSSRSEVPES